MAAKRPVCKYGAECYRKNTDHLKNYYHPTKADEVPKVSTISKSAFVIYCMDHL